MQAVAILAHTAPDHVIRLARVLRESFEVYIHFDTKTALPDDHKTALDELGVHYYQEINVNWGSFSIGAAAKFLMEKALENPEISHVHIISGQCWPTKPVKEIYRFYENNPHLYMEYYPAAGIKKSGEPIIWWQKYYYNYDKIPRRTLFGKLYHRASLAVQTLLRVNKFKKYQFDMEIYHGANWMDLPRDAIQYLLSYWNTHSHVQKVFETGFCSDEFWVQTILYNSPFRDRLANDIHRYILWEERHGSYPAILDEQDYAAICEGDYHFCRKVAPGTSEALIRLLESR